jgi:uncharacterized protein YjiS (DUF1127 family)
MTTEATYNEYSPIGDSISSQPALKARSVSSVMRRIMKPLVRSHWERESIRELSGLPSHILRDIGMSRYDIQKVSKDLAKERADAWARQAEASNGFGG